MIEKSKEIIKEMIIIKKIKKNNDFSKINNKYIELKNVKRL